MSRWYCFDNDAACAEVPSARRCAKCPETRLAGPTAAQAPGYVTLADDGRTPILVSPATGALTGAQPAPAESKAVRCGMQGFCGIPDECELEGRCLATPAPAAQPADSAMGVLSDLADEVARVLPILVRAEDSGLWSELAAGTGVATTNALVHVLQRARALTAASKERSKTHEA